MPQCSPSPSPAHSRDLRALLGVAGPCLGWGSCWGLRVTGLALRLLAFRGCSMLKIGGGPKSGSGCARVVTSWGDRNRTRARRLASCSNSHLGGWMPAFLPTNPDTPPPPSLPNTYRVLGGFDGGRRAPRLAVHR